VISIPEQKAAMLQPGPLSDERRARLLDVMGQFYGMFVADVAKGRGVTAARVKADFGGGDILTALEAKAAGMIDRIETFDATLSRLGTKRGAMVSVRATSDVVPVEAMVDPVVLAAVVPQSEPKADMIEPENGECPDGYELGEDDRCHLMPAEDAKAEAAPATVEARARQARADADLTSSTLALVRST
jgi:ClpP class serine protease